MSRIENLVQVADPEGNIHEIRRRNATDLVQHKGWTWVDKEEPNDLMTLKLATAPRATKQVGAKLAKAQKRMFAEITPEPEDMPKKRGRPPKVEADAAAAELPKPKKPARIEAVDEELLELEREERARMSKDVGNA